MHRGITIADLSDEITSVKSHDEILQLIQEIEELEQRIQQDDFVEFEAVPDTSTIHDFGEVPSDGTTGIPLDDSIKQRRKLAVKKGLLHHRRSLDKEVSGRDRLEAFLHPEPVRNVFVLRLTKGGELVGFNLKKPKQPREKISIKTMFKRKTQTGEPAKTAEPVKGIKGKLLAIPSRIRLKGTGERSSPVAGAISKIKGIFSRK